MLYSLFIAGYTGAAVREVLWTEGDVVRKLRLVAGWKLKDLVKRSGVSLTMIHELETGKTKEAKRSTLTKIAGAFGLSYHDLLDQVPTKPVKIDIPPALIRNMGEGHVPTLERRHARGKKLA